MEIFGKVVLCFLAAISLVSGVKLWADGFTDLGTVSFATGLGLFGFVYWGLQQ